LGCEVETAASGNEALEIIRNDSFQLALVDMKMPGMNGIETIEQLLFLSEKECDEAQGFYFYRPMQAEELERILHL
jgi:CheY-like chemotaxis protein